MSPSPRLRDDQVRADKRGTRVTWASSGVLSAVAVLGAVGVIAARQLGDAYAIGYFYTALALAAGLGLLVSLRALGTPAAR